MVSKGSYPKGRAKREEILRRALEVIDTEGIGHASVREIAAAVDLSPAGLLHYFDSKDDLFTQILSARDDADRRRSGRRTEAPADVDPDAGADTDATATAHAEADPDADTDADAVLLGLLGVIEHNAQVPGLVELFSRMSVEAAEPASPAHSFFDQRGTRLRATLTEVFTHLQSEGRVDPELDPEALSRILQAVIDGLQLQWLLDTRVDMAGLTRELVGLIVAPAPAENDRPRT